MHSDQRGIDRAMHCAIWQDQASAACNLYSLLGWTLGILPPPLSGHQDPCCCRSCVSCGATKTPQWREGPLGALTDLAEDPVGRPCAGTDVTPGPCAGPKTLCNACGVKRCRQMRMLVEGKRASAPKPAVLQRRVRSVALPCAALPVRAGPP